MPDPDLKAHLHALLRRNLDLLVKDFHAIPADRKTVSPGGCARSPVPILAECAMVNGMIATYLGTGERTRRTPEQRQAHLAAFDTPEKALAYLEGETERLLAVIDGLDPATFGDDCSELFGRPMTRFAAAEFPGIHMMYHDGQLNFVHTLCGDAEMHW